MTEPDALAAAVGTAAPPRQQSFTIVAPGPLDAAASLEMFRRNGDDLLDRWDGATLLRTLPMDALATTGSRSVAFACQPLETHERDKTLTFRITVEESANPASQAIIEQVMRAMFPAPPTDFAALRQRDPVVDRLAARYPGVRPILQFDLLAALVRAISAQQVNLRWATITRRRLAEAYGERHVFGPNVESAADQWEVYSLSAAKLAQAQVSDLRAMQFTTRKAEYIIGVAQAIASGAVTLAQLSALPDDEVITRLVALRGIGRWTAEWILARTLGRPRVVAGDLGVRKASGQAYLDEPLPPEDAVRAATTHWGESALVAQNLLLHALAEGTL